VGPRDNPKNTPNNPNPNSEAKYSIVKHSVVKSRSDQHSVVILIQRSDAHIVIQRSDTAYSDPHSVVVITLVRYSGRCRHHQKWLTQRAYDCIILTTFGTVQIESSLLRQARSLWNYHAFTVSTMAHGRGLNAVFF